MAPPTPATPSKARRDAIVAAVEADPTLLTLLAGDRIYLRQPPPNSPLPYIVLGAVSERNESRYHEPGHVADEMPSCWGRTLWEAEQVYAALVPVLHRQRLPLAGHRMIQGSLERLTDLPDPTGMAHQVVSRYRVTSRQSP